MSSEAMQTVATRTRPSLTGEGQTAEPAIQPVASFCAVLEVSHADAI
jgi:hypothetical protein